MIVTKGHAISFASSLITPVEAETLRFGVANYGHLLRQTPLAIRREHSFADLADSIEQTYSVAQPITATVVATLRTVHARHVVGACA